MRVLLLLILQKTTFLNTSEWIAQEIEKDLAREPMCDGPPIDDDWTLTIEKVSDYLDLKYRSKYCPSTPTRQTHGQFAMPTAECNGNDEGD